MGLGVAPQADPPGPHGPVPVLVAIGLAPAGLRQGKIGLRLPGHLALDLADRMRVLTGD